MNGIINVLKPPGMTSHHVVSFIRRVLNTKRVGHTGTLDPGAAGVLPVCVGKGTRVVPFLIDKNKRYIAEMTLGISTDTQDASGETVDMNTDFKLAPSTLADVIRDFVGVNEQIPPMASAVRVGGKRLYEYARAGQEVERKARSIKIFEIHINKIWPELKGPEPLSFGSRVLLDVSCSKGTYVRTLCHDIGEKLGAKAHMSFLSRITSGPFAIEDSFTLEEIAHLSNIGDSSYLLPMEAGLPDWPRIKVDPLAEKPISHGNPISSEHFIHVPTELYPDDYVCLQDLSGELLALAKMKLVNDQLICQPTRVIKE